MFVCFLDASAAFDRIKFVTFQKFKDKDVPSYLIRFLCFWYMSQKLCVRWNSNYSESFHVTNGVAYDKAEFCHLICLKYIWTLLALS